MCNCAASVVVVQQDWRFNAVSKARSRRRNIPQALARERIGTDYRGEALEVLVPRGRGPLVSVRSGGKLLMRSLFLAIALLAGIACGLFNLQTGAALLTAVWLAVASLVLTLLKPSFAWMSATAVGIGVPAVYLWATLAGAEIRYPPAPNIASTLLALLPSVAAALLALAIRRLLLGAPAPGAHR